MIARIGLAVISAATIGVGVLAGRGHRSSVPYIRSSAMTPEWLTDREARSASMHRVEAFQFSNQSGSIVSERALDGRVTIVSFFFTTCGDVCPTTMSNLSRVLTALPNQSKMQVLSYSVRPDSDSVPALRMFATMHHVTDARWQLLTGPRPDLERLARDSYFVTLTDGSTYGVRSIAHTESVLLVDGCRRLRGVYAGTLALEMQRLREDAAVLLREVEC